jgi:tripartite-type tricarboxylate transporter receptor subunit TctC
MAARNTAPGAQLPPRRAVLGVGARAVALAGWLALGPGPAGLVAVAAAGSASLVAAAEQWPVRPIRLVVPYPAGGPLDQVARALAEPMRQTLGQPVVVDNRPGAGGNIGADLIAKAEPDGYSIVMGAVATHAINPYLYDRMPYDPNRDFSPIARIAVVPNVLVMTPQTMERLGIGSIRDLIGYARRHPGRLNFASGGSGSAGHLAGELLKSRARISMVHIPYKGAAPAKAGLLAGETDLMFDNLASAMPQVRGGQLRPLAITTAARDRLAPDVPTVAESGVKDFDINTWFGLFGPARLPPAVLDRLVRATTDAMKTPPVMQTLDRLGAAAAPLAPDAFDAYVRAEQRKYRELVRVSGATVD